MYKCKTYATDMYSVEYIISKTIQTDNQIAFRIYKYAVMCLNIN